MSWKKIQRNTDWNFDNRFQDIYCLVENYSFKTNYYIIIFKISIHNEILICKLFIKKKRLILYLYCILYT